MRCRRACLPVPLRSPRGCSPGDQLGPAGWDTRAATWTRPDAQTEPGGARPELGLPQGLSADSHGLPGDTRQCPEEATAPSARSSSPLLLEALLAFCLPSLSPLLRHSRRVRGVSSSGFLTLIHLPLAPAWAATAHHSPQGRGVPWGRRRLEQEAWHARRPAQVHSPWVSFGDVSFPRKTPVSPHFSVSKHGHT